MQKAFSVIAILAATAVPAGAQALVDNFENGVNGWAFQNLTPTAGWNIDGAPAVFVSPSNTLNNADTTVGLAEAGNGDAYSPNAILTTGSDKFIQFRCRYFITENLRPMRRLLNIGTAMPGGATHVGIFLNSPDSTMDDPVLGANQFVVDCPGGGDWHLHTFQVTPSSSEIVHNGSIIIGSAAQANTVKTQTTLNVDFHFEWNEQLVPPPPQYGIIVWLIDDLMVTADLNDPFGTGAGAASGATGGGGGGGSSGCAASQVRGGSWAAPIFALALAAAAWLGQKKANKFA